MPTEPSSLALIAGVVAGAFAVVQGAFALLRPMRQDRATYQQIVTLLQELSARLHTLEIWHNKENPMTGLPRAYFDPKALLDLSKQALKKLDELLERDS